MSVNTTLAGLSQTAASNGPDGASDPPSSLDDAIRYALSFIAQLRDGNGFTAQLGTRNRIINGNFAINQRTVSGTVTLAAGAYGHDRWKAGASGCTYTFASSGLDTTLTISAGSLQQVIEGVNVEGGTYTMSWSGSAQGKINGGSYSASGVQATGVSAAASLTVEFGVGTLTKVQVEQNTTASQFERRPLAIERLLAYRYFQTSYVGVVAGTGDPTGRISVISFDSGTGVTSSPVFLPVEMRATPTVTIYNSTTGAVGSMRNEETGVDIPAVLGSGASPKTFRVLNNNTTLFPRTLSYHYTASAEL